jgi:phosphomannomutase
VNTEIFKAYDIRGKVGDELNADVAERVGKALADWLPEEGTVAVGRDMRPDSEKLAEALIEGLRLQGREVWNISQVTSDMLYFAIGHWDIAGGAVVTASHNPGEYNGIKIYRDKVAPVGLESGLDEIRDKAVADDFVPALKMAPEVKKSITKEWVKHALSFVDTDKWPTYRIAIDNGNGMAGAILPDILPKLPLEAEEMYFEPDGSFPNHEANPQKYENLQDLMRTVKENNYDFGVAFDGDGDRAVFVDDLGRPVLGTDVITIIAKYYIEQYPGAEIVHDVRTSRATTELITQWGGTPIRTKAGRVNVGREVREHGAPFGGETTGHMFFKDNFDADSGLIAMVVFIQALAESGKKLSELVDTYRMYVMIPEMNIEVESKEGVFDRLRQVFDDGEQDDLDGLTVDYADKWFNVRASNTEPVLRLNAEAKTKEQLDELVQKAVDTIKQ